MAEVVGKHFRTVAALLGGEGRRVNRDTNQVGALCGREAALSTFVLFGI